MLPLPPTPPASGALPEWCRKVAGLINGLLSRQTFAPASVAPSSPRVGDGWFDITVNRAKIWDGTTWQPLW